MLGKVGRDSGLQGVLGAKQTQINRAGTAAKASSLITGAASIAYKAEQMTDIIQDFAKSSQNSSSGVIGLTESTNRSVEMSLKFTTDILIQSSLMEAPEIPAPYFPPLLYCTEYDQVFGARATTNGTVVFSFRNIGNMFVEDQSQPRSIPIQQIPDSDEDNLQDMGRGSGYIKISGRVFGQAGLSRLNMLRDLCHYKGKEGLIFIDKNIGKYRVYPANIPGYTSSAEFFNQYVFEITFLIVGNTNKKKVVHKVIGESLKKGLAVANAGIAIRAELYRDIDGFKRTIDQLSVSEAKSILKNLIVKYNGDINDEKIDLIYDIIIGITITQTDNGKFLNEDIIVEIIDPIRVKRWMDVVLSPHMENGYTDGITKTYWFPEYESGEEFEIYYKRVYLRLNEEDVLADGWEGDLNDIPIVADRGRIIDEPWKLLVETKNFTMLEKQIRPNYPGLWTRIDFYVAPEKWGIIKCSFVTKESKPVEFHVTKDIFPYEELFYLDWVIGSINENLIQDNLIPYPISGSTLSVIETTGVTKLYLPELLDDHTELNNLKVYKRIGEEMKIVDSTEYTVIPSTDWVGGKLGKFGMIEFNSPITLGEFISVSTVFKNVSSAVAFEHPYYIIKNSYGNNMSFLWLESPKITVIGSSVFNMVLSPNSPNNSLYNYNFLTKLDTIYWIKGGINEEEDIIIRLSDGTGSMIELDPLEYTITSLTSRPGKTGNWGKIEFNTAPLENRILTITCKLQQSITSFRTTFKNSNILVSDNPIELLFMEDVSDPYINSTYNKIYPILDGGNTSSLGVIKYDGIDTFWIPKIVYIEPDIISELYPLNVILNSVNVTNYTIEYEAERIFENNVEIFTKIIFNSPIPKGSVIEVNFTSESESVIYNQKYLQEVEESIFTDETKPMKNKLNTRIYYTPFCIDTSKPIEITIDGIMIPESDFELYHAVSRTHENADGVILKQTVGQIKFNNFPGDDTDINIKYNRLETPYQETIKFSVYLADDDDDSFSEIKDYYQRNKLIPEEVKVTDINGRFFDFTKLIYYWPYPNGKEYSTYKNTLNSQQFVYRAYDGIGQTYSTVTNKYSFSDLGFKPNMSNTDQYNSDTTPFSIDLSIPKEFQDNWIGRYNQLVSIYSNATKYQEREIASMLLGKLIGNADFSDDTYITEEDVRNAKLWIQVYNDYIDSDEFVESKKMLDERTKLLEKDLNGNLKESNKEDIITIPNELPNPVDLPPVEEWYFEETYTTMKYTKEYVDVILYTKFHQEVINLKTKYRTALDEGIFIYITTNNADRIYYDNTYLYRIRIVSGTKIEEYQYNIASELLDAIQNGQTVTVDGGSTVEFSPSELITSPELYENMENKTLRLLNKTIFQKEKFEIDKNTYEIFLLAIYGDIDAINRSVELPYYKFKKYKEIIGRNEASLTLEEGLDFYRFNKIKTV